MITHGDGFIVRHNSGRFLRARWGDPIKHPGGGLQWVWSYELVDDPLAAEMVRVRAFCGRFLNSSEWATVADQFEVVPRPGCGCCGSDYARRAAAQIWSEGGIYRCDRHRDRNPCAVEGCRRTRVATQLADDAWLCGNHWRQICPPRSAYRRAYHRFWRIGRRHGWSPVLELRFRRFWRALIKRARRAGAGDLDMTEVNKLFGWAA